MHSDAFYHIVLNSLTYAFGLVALSDIHVHSRVFMHIHSHMHLPTFEFYYISVQSGCIHGTLHSTTCTFSVHSSHMLHSIALQRIS